MTFDVDDYDDDDVVKVVDMTMITMAKTTLIRG